MTLGTFLVGALLVLIVGFILWSLHRNKKAGKCSCGSDCGSCPGCAHKLTPKGKENP